MRSAIPLQATPLITRLGTLRKRRRNATIELRDINVVQEFRVSQASLDQFWILDKQILARATDTWILAAKRRYKHGRLAVVVELVVNRALRADSTLVQADGSEHGLVEAVFEDKTSVEALSGDKEDNLCCAVVNVE